MALDYSKLKWADLLAKAQQDHQQQWGSKDSFDPYTGGITDFGGGKGAQIFLDSNSDDPWSNVVFNLNNPDDPNQPLKHMTQLYRKEDGGVGSRYYEMNRGMPVGLAAVLAAPFAAAALGLGAGGAAAGTTAGASLGSGVSLGAGGATGITGAIGTSGLTAGAGTGLGLTTAGAGSALGSLGTGFFGAETLAGLGGAAVGAGAASAGGLFGNGGVYGTGMSTGNTFGDWLVQKGINQAGKGVVSSLSGGRQSTGTSNGVSNMSDNVLLDLLTTGATAGVLNNSGQRVTDAYNLSADNVMNVANQLKDQGKFTPYNIRTGVGGSVDVGNGEQHTYLSPKWQQFQDQAMSQIPGLLNPYTNQNVSDISGQAYGLSQEWLNKRANPLYAANEQKGLFGAGNLLDKAAGFDPESAAKSEYDLMQQIYAPTRENDNLNMENRLLQQGRLGLNYGTYGAAPELMALKEAQRMQDLNATKDSRQLAFDRQNNMISQAGALNNIGIQSGAAGTAQQKAYYDMANGLFGMGMSGDKFIEDMNNSRTARAGTLQNMAMKPEEFVSNVTGQALTAGANRSSAEQANARLFGNMALEAERLRSGGAFADAGFKNARDNAILQSVSGKGGAGGLLSGAGGGMGQVTDLAKKLLGMGVPAESLTQVMGDLGIDMNQFTDSWDFDVSNLDMSESWSDVGDLFDF